MSKRLTTSEFIEKAKKVHGDKYDYSKTEYIDSHSKVCVICHKKDESGTEHGEFYQSPNHHKNGEGCPKCKADKFFTLDIYLSKREKQIINWLNKNNIKFKHNEWVKVYDLNIRPDFIIENVFIEFNGRLHYEFSKFFHKTELGFLKQQYRDEQLRRYCKENNITLIEIRYDENVENKLEEFKFVLIKNDK